MGPISSLAGPVHIVGHLDDPTLQFSRAQNRALVGDVSLGNEGLFKHAIVTSQLGWAYEMKRAGAAMRTQHPTVEVVRRRCGGTHGLAQERMAASSVPRAMVCRGATIWSYR